MIFLFPLKSENILKGDISLFVYSHIDHIDLYCDCDFPKGVDTVDQKILLHCYALKGQD